MNKKEKLDEIKAKIKKYAPITLTISSAVAVAAYAIHSTLKTNNTVLFVGIEPLPHVDRETQMELMNDENFYLVKLTDDEYMFARDPE